MCGIAGIWHFSAEVPAERLHCIAGAMAEAVRHRGPDSGDVWHDETAGIALAHRRLAIVDLSEAGAQPMRSHCGRYVIVYNGEVYNADALRRELTQAGHAFRGHSDTEVLLAAISAWGIRAAVERLVGMFAIGLWDRQQRELTLIRDRVGIKPVYWANAGNRFLFGSELKALRAVPGWTASIDPASLTSYLRYNYVPAPNTIYIDVHKMQPGTILTVRAGRPPVTESYWTMADACMRGLAKRSEIDARDEQGVIDALDDLLSEAVRMRMVADVPVGAFLSGGIDSSLVVALMQKAATGPVRTFSIGHEDATYDEARHAKAVAAHLGTDHTELYVSADDALAVIPRLPEMFDEPFADSSQIPTYLVSEMTRRHVTVALSGDGGDELFAGYNHYFLADAIRRRQRFVPATLARIVGAAITRVRPERWDSLANLIPNAPSRNHLGDKLHKASQVLGRGDCETYRFLVSRWPDPAGLVHEGREPLPVNSELQLAGRMPCYIERMQYMDAVTYLPDDILTKVDRASMAVALEARVPLLDHRVVEFAWQLPMRYKVRNGTRKWSLRQVLARYLPNTLFDRPKKGFAVPIDQWLREPLREWAEDLLSEERIRRDGLLQLAPIRQVWGEHISGSRNWHYRLWTVLMFQAWQALAAR